MGDNLKEIILPPPDVYPPDWNKKDMVMDEIVNQALSQADTQLFEDATFSWDKSNERSQFLHCKYGRTCYIKGKSNDVIFNNSKTSSPAEYNENIWLDRLVNKDKA